MGREIQKFKLERGGYSLVALDHGLTYGVSQGIEPLRVKSLLQVCNGQIGGVVLTFGLAKYIELAEGHVPVILQCFGGPLGSEKVQISSIEQALLMGAAAVSVQLKLSSEGCPPSSCAREIGRFVARAYEHNLPVLFMVSVHDHSNLLSVADAIRISQEMGADLIKVRVVVRETESSDNVETLAAAVRQAPPVLLAGGPLSSDLIADAHVAAQRLLFKGYCIGRNIYQADDPLSVVFGLNEVWGEFKATNPYGDTL